MMTAIMQNADREIHLFRIENYGKCSSIESVYHDIFDALTDDFQELYLSIEPTLLADFDISGQLRELERLAVQELRPEPPQENKVPITPLFGGSPTSLVPVTTLIKRRLVPAINAVTGTQSKPFSAFAADTVCGRPPYNHCRAEDQRVMIRKFLASGYFFQNYVKHVGGPMTPPLLLSSFTQNSCIMRSPEVRTNYLSLDFFPTQVPSIPGPPKN